MPSTVTFDELEESIKIQEIVEYSKPFYKWVNDNNKSPDDFSDWPKIIKEYHKYLGTKWNKEYAIPSPYADMGYDIIKPPKIIMQPIG